MSIQINNFQDLKELVESTQTEDKWSVHAFVATIDGITGPLFNITPADPKLPAMAGVKALGGLDFTGLIIGQNVLACFDANGNAWIMGPVLDTIDSDYVPLGTALISFLNEFVQQFMTHLHVAAGNLTGGPVDITQTPIIITVPADLLSTTTKVKV